MPGLSSRNPVAGYGNIGKVQIRFKPKPPKKPYIGVVLFLFCTSLLLFSWSWTDPWRRNAILLPAMRYVLKYFDSYRSRVTDKTVVNSRIHDISMDVDDLGRPFVGAESIQNVIFGQGYVHAKNRMFQMDLNRHKAYGTLSSWQGERALPSDLMARVLGISSNAKGDLALQSDVEQEYLQSYTDGVNAYIEEGHSLPIEYSLLGLSEIEAWTPLDSLAVLRYHSTLSSEIWELELTQYMVSQEPKSENFTSSFAFPSHEHGSETRDTTVLPSVSSSTAWVMQTHASASETATPLHSTRIVTEVCKMLLFVLVVRGIARCNDFILWGKHDICRVSYFR
jgi:acyl-homoserine lactone acylase PvdQ